MFCEHCGAQLADGAKFCTACGARVAPAAPAGSDTLPKPEPAPTMACPHCGALQWPGDAFCTACGQPLTGTASEGGGTAPNGSEVPRGHKPTRGSEGPKKRRRWPFVVIVIVLLVAAAAGALLYLSTTGFTFPWQQANETEEEAGTTVEVYYASEEPITVSTATVIVVHDLEGEPLEGFQVILEPVEAEAELSWTSATVDVSGTDEFTVGAFSNIVPGTYEMSIVDSETEDEYQCPTIDVVEEGSDEAEDVPDTVELIPDPDDPESAIAEPEATYSYTTQSIEVTIVHTESDYTSTVESTWIYPQFTSSVENSALDELNERIAAEVEETLEAAESWTIDDYDGQCLEYEATVTYLSENIACVRYESYSTHWGAHGGTNVTGEVYNLETGEEITPESVFGLTSSERSEAAVEALTAYLEQNPSDLYELSDLTDIIESIASNSERYYIAEEGLIVVSAEYELGSFAWGWVEVVVVAFEDESLVGTDVSGTYASWATS